jgi:hypothetical protein
LDGGADVRLHQASRVVAAAVGYGLRDLAMLGDVRALPLDLGGTA